MTSWAQMVKNQIKSNPPKCRRHGFDPWVGKIPWRREQLPTAVFLPGESHGQRSLVDYSPRGYKESDTTKRQTLSHVHPLHKKAKS